jgi:hypothetical protein
MNGHGDGGHDREHDDHGHPHEREERKDGGSGDRGGTPDTRFLQLEMSQVLYGEAEGIARPAFREVLLAAAKERILERFGKQITALANLAVDELLDDAFASLEIEDRIKAQREASERSRERVREIFAAGSTNGGGAGQRRAAAARKRRKARR